MDILRQVADNEVEYATWYLSLSPRLFAINAESCRSSIEMLYRVIHFMEEGDDKEMQDKYTKLFELIYGEFSARMKG